jgi:hypothetical protein
MFRCAFLKSAVRLAHVQLTTEGAADNVDQVTGQAIKVRAHRNLARRSSEGGGVEDVGATNTAFVAAGSGTRGRGAGVGGANPRGNQHIAQVSIALICNKRGKGKNAIEGGVLLQEVEMLEEDMFDREVMGMVGEDQDGAVLGLG